MVVNDFRRKKDNVSWLIDSGAANHLVRDGKLLQNPVTCSDKEFTVRGFSGKTSVISATGKAYLPISVSQGIELHDVLYVPESKDNLISVSRLTTDYPFCIMINPSGFVVKNIETQKEIAKSHLNGPDYFWPNVSSILTEVSEDVRIKSMKKVFSRLLVRIVRKLTALLQGLWYNFFDLEAEDAWIVDTGAVAHITNDAKLLQNLRPASDEFPSHTDFAGRKSQVTHVGDAHLPGQDDQDIILHNVLVIPEANWNTISVSKFISDHPSCFEFRSDGFVLKSLHEKNKVIARGPKIRKWYRWLNKKNIESSK